VKESQESIYLSPTVAVKVRLWRLPIATWIVWENDGLREVDSPIFTTRVSKPGATQLLRFIRAAGLADRFHGC
jgi:hypothetical protein